MTASQYLGILATILLGPPIVDAALRATQLLWISRRAQRKLIEFDEYAYIESYFLCDKCSAEQSCVPPGESGGVTVQEAMSIGWRFTDTDDGEFESLCPRCAGE